MITFEIREIISTVDFINGNDSYCISIDSVANMAPMRWRESIRCTSDCWIDKPLLPVLYEARKACIKRGLIHHDYI